MTKITAQYAAGFIDGEGCLTICRKRNHNNGYSYAAVVCVANVHRRVVADFASQFGGRLSCRNERRGNFRDHWVAFWQAERTRRLIQTIQPFLRLKAPQAELLLSFLDFKATLRIPGRGGYSLEQRTALHGYYYKARLMNRVGRRPLQIPLEVSQ